MTTTTCDNCAFFQKAVITDRRRAKDGYCHRHAPSPLVGGSGTGWSDWEWPAVNNNEWCGEWLQILKDNP